jgi:serine/threonine-protein kinase RIO1
MEKLFEAGADVPKPYAKEKNAILMEFVGDRGMAAPALSSVSLERDEAQPLFERVIRNLDIMLANDRIHGDLSAYNILYWDGDIKLIDFPQVVIPESNPASWGIFQRDVMRICQYFSAQGLRTMRRNSPPTCGRPTGIVSSRRCIPNISTPRTRKTASAGRRRNNVTSCMTVDEG